MIINPNMLKKLRAYYTPGTRIELIRMNDLYTNLKPGDTGTVISVDDIGTIHINWDIGSTLGVAYGEDYVVKIIM